MNPIIKKIQKKNSPFIIAEVGSNWSNIDDCIDSVKVAARCGADAVKFQLYSAQSLFGKQNASPLKFELDPQWLHALKDVADNNNVELMCTPFSIEEAKLVDEFVNIHKIASAEMEYSSLIATMAVTKKPLIISTGGQSLESVQIAYDTARAYLMPCQIVLLACNPTYPAPDPIYNNVTYLKYAYPGALVGYSDHCMNILEHEDNLAFLDCAVIEKHFKLRDEPSWPDNGHAILPEQFKNYVTKISVEQKWTEVPFKHKRQWINGEFVRPWQNK